MRRRLAFLAPLLVVASACAGAGGAASAGAAPPRGLGVEDARVVLSRFAVAVEAGRWPEAWALLSVRWRQAYTPSRLSVDYAGGGPAAREAASRVIALVAGGAPVRVEGALAVLPVGTDRAAVLVAEDGGWRVDALE
ncbi:hypothetical protein [Anaeromyxobacter oryzae]|nr:hypothetical protein [Anaeromyxobacter oryzae]